MKEGKLKLGGWTIKGRVDKFGMLHIDIDSGSGNEARYMNTKKYSSVGRHFRGLFSSDKLLQKLEDAPTNADRTWDKETWDQWASHPAVKANGIV